MNVEAHLMNIQFIKHVSHQRFEPIPKKIKNCRTHLVM